MSKVSDIYSRCYDKYFYLGLFIGLLIILATTIYTTNFISGILFACIPISCVIIFYLFKRPHFLLIIIFIINYIIMGICRYVSGLAGGIVMDTLLALILFILIVRTVFFTVDCWKRFNNPLTYLSLFWLIYCIMEILNPYTTIELWMTSVRGLGFYLFLFVVVTTALFKRYKDLKQILCIWGILTIFAILKAVIQKFIGFDWAENHWLYAEDGAKTHIIYSGIRYFSFFTDAANFGCSMALSMVVFSISALYIKSKKLRVFFIIVAILAGYGMLISGTRTALGIPFIGYTTFILVSKRIKIIIGGTFLILSLFFFFNFTDIGQNNGDIRRMRTAFQGTEDASFNVRIENQKKMREFMPNHPFGIGIGKAKHTDSKDHMYGLATDSSLIYVWIETGIVGLILFISIFLFVLGRGIYDILFRIKNKELKGIMSALIAGLSGILIASYGNEVLQQFPTGPILYICMTFIMMGRYFDKEIENREAENSKLSSENEYTSN